MPSLRRSRKWQNPLVLTQAQLSLLLESGSTGGRQGEEVGFAIDSPVEEGGFEPSVPPANELVSSAGHACAPGAKDGLGAVVHLAGTKGSNPVPSSGESHELRSPATRLPGFVRITG
jgi:hypothetical protein